MHERMQLGRMLRIVQESNSNSMESITSLVKICNSMEVDSSAIEINQMQLGFADQALQRC